MNKGHLRGFSLPNVHYALIPRFELDAYWFAQPNGLLYREQACFGITCKHLDAVAVTTGTKQIATIGCESEVAWMELGGLIANLAEFTCDGIHLED